MKRYFYSGNILLKKWLDNQYNMIRLQDKIYRDALLAAINIQPERLNNFSNLRQQILNMSIPEQLQYSNNYHLQSLFKHFDSLHRNTRSRKMLIRGQQSLSRDLVDPDKFPVWDLKSKPNVFYSIWSSVMGGIRYDFGHQLTVGASLVQHPEGGRGVFLRMAGGRGEVAVGDFLGLVPGAIYQSYQSYEKLRLANIRSYQKQPQHLHFPSGRVLELGQYSQYDQISKTQVNIQPYMVNPYSLGQFINHPPYGKMPNVIFSQIECKPNFFPSYYKKYLPYKSYLPIPKNKKQPKLLIYGIFARQPIKNNQQLYVDYCQNHIYPITKIPQWLIEPEYPTASSNPSPQCLPLSKQEYENPSPQYWQLLQKQALKKNQKLYEEYLKVIRYRPQKVLYEDQGIRIRKMGAGVGTTPLGKH